MSQFDKLIQQIYNLDKNLRFEQICKVLESLGYVMSGPASGSSHKTFRKPGRESITVPQHSPIKQFYVKKVKDAIESEDNYEKKS